MGCTQGGYGAYTGRVWGAHMTGMWNTRRDMRGQDRADAGHGWCGVCEGLGMHRVAGGGGMCNSGLNGWCPDLKPSAVYCYFPADWLSY